MESTNQSNFFDGCLKFIKPLRLSGFNANAILDSRRKDVEALATVGTTALTGIQSLGQKQIEILSGTMTRVRALTGKQPGQEARPAAASEAVQQAFYATLSDVRELFGTAYRAHSDSYAVISKRVAENVEELRALLQPRK
ncbi:phasin family protein [Caballeronia sp. EK]|uniref:phasin family protein n=1 Tax=Caballeronia sp. EK TaxID=2767469 RepID=UPI0016551EC1|nr:phasin family protein [Caballeronia sp. EK]MBC8635405.1 phasin family protein [Caballeronia sp. EK]